MCRDNRACGFDHPEDPRQADWVLCPDRGLIRDTGPHWLGCYCAEVSPAGSRCARCHAVFLMRRKHKVTNRAFVVLEGIDCLCHLTMLRCPLHAPRGRFDPKAPLVPGLLEAQLNTVLRLTKP